MFYLKDTDYHIVNGEPQRVPLDSKRLLREIEIAPLVHLHSKALAEVTHAIYHPQVAWKEWRGRLVYKLGGKEKSSP